MNAISLRVALESIGKIVADALRQSGDSTTPKDTKRLATIRETARLYPFLSEASLRDKIYHSRKRFSARGETIPANGWASCVVRVGNTGPKTKILLDLDEIDRLIESGRGS